MRQMEIQMYLPLVPVIPPATDHLSKHHSPTIYDARVIAMMWNNKKMDNSHVIWFR